MTQARTGDTVKVNYTGKLDDGTVFDSSAGRDPLQFTIGQGQLIPGFEDAVIGMLPGDTKIEKIPAAEAYGLRNEQMVAEVQREHVPPDLELQVGQNLRVEHPDGSGTMVVVAALSETSVTLDANHPLAGKDLTFEIELVGIVPEAA